MAIKGVGEKIAGMIMRMIEGRGAGQADEVDHDAAQPRDVAGALTGESASMLETDRHREGEQGKKKRRRENKNASNEAEDETSEPAHRPDRQYQPKTRSGAYALLIGLYRMEKGIGTGVCVRPDRETLAKFSQQWADERILCDRAHYCGWDSMNRTLVPKGLVQAYRNGPRKVFELSQEGRALAEALNVRVLESETGEAGGGSGSESVATTSSIGDRRPGDRNVGSHEPSDLRACELVGESAAGSRRLPDGSKLEVLLLVDNNEPPEVLHFVEAKHIRYKRTQLMIGDFMWVAVPQAVVVAAAEEEVVAEEKEAEKGLQGQEVASVKLEDAIVLDFIIERKSVSDLHSSVISKRYESQKYRLQRSGFSRIVYLLENSVDGMRQSGYHDVTEEVEKRIRSSTVDIQIHSQFFLHQTGNWKETVDLLHLMTQKISLMLRNQGLSSDVAMLIEHDLVTFKAFSDRMKNLSSRTFSELLQIQLASAVQGLGSKAVDTLVEEFATLPALLDFCRRCQSLENFKKIVTQKFREKNNRALNPKVIERLWMLCEGREGGQE
ncbi:Mus81 endonuclease, DNA recombination, crossover formation in meiosis and mitosis [Guillardia theta CCMP2712]|uniref:Crossover junction endonuclease MUS81 n=1 Tax=Guillardia theta (strain CCMP2712) TaxID=905079 RepID=L1J716_GUITC|nr:Mus81 endonuclease, DNA recombination, crossover formation in meiosis and mitosis [Guillardia theta CCMP2712]EKX43870.1 Mus81 endonuclease, DNA recombination, crossover formation in meiosis and mitosis [Guillardia theta CCMP2712]|eukprot:XP_005830850.1 Mus81 endonuclease, DNA recombination, crossover formation in meiosis and mitosis [Guillardia theta CCMP2712]